MFMGLPIKVVSHLVINVINDLFLFLICDGDVLLAPVRKAEEHCGDWLHVFAFGFGELLLGFFVAQFLVWKRHLGLKEA